jgi:uncharacterized membrane protein YphA (DoxX/SURF4 family)
MRIEIMKTLLTLFKTNNSFTPLIARLTLGLVMFPHGAQKALGWFGGPGFSGTMNFFTGQLHIPALFAFLAIAAEFAGSIGLITGFFSRVCAFGIAVVTSGSAQVRLSHPLFDFRAHFFHSAPMETHAFGFRLRANAPEGQKRFPISRLTNEVNSCSTTSS